MKIIFPILVYIFLLSTTCVAEPVRIEGQIKGADGNYIRLVTYLDQISKLKKTLASTLIDDQGNFVLNTDIEKVTYAFLETGFETAEIFLQPGGKYQLNLTFSPLAEGSGYYNRKNLGVTFIKDLPDSLNIHIRDVNELFNDFIIKNFDPGQRNLLKSKLQEFIRETDDKTAHSKNPYLKNYILYKIASLEQSLRLKSSVSLSKAYLTNKPVLFNNVEYIDFFNKFYEKALITNSKYFSYSKTYDLIDGEGGVNSLLSYLKKDSLIAGDELRELVLLGALKDLYYNGGFKRERIILLCEQMGKKTNYSQIRTISVNLIKRFNRLSKGSPAPAFSLYDLQGKKYSLEDFRGKYVYLDFFDSRNAIGISEMNLMKDLYPKIKNEVEFVSICINNSKGDLEEFLKKNNFPWPVLWLSNDYNLLDEYNAGTFPLYVLIDRQGKIDFYPAPSPSENLEEVLNSLKTE